MAKNSEQEFYQANDLLQAVFDSAQNGIAVLKAIYNAKGVVEDFSVLLLNAYMLNLIGEIEYKGRRYSDIFPMVKETIIVDKFKEVIASGIPVNFEQYTGEDKNHWSRFTAAKQGDLLIVTTEDITKQKKSAEAITAALQKTQQQQRLYNSITSYTPDLIYVFDRAHRFTYANEALLTMWGKTFEDAVGRGLRENGYEEWHALMHEREIDEVVATKKWIRGTVSFLHSQLGKRIYEYIFAPIFDEQGEVEAIAGTGRDISDIKHFEETIKQSEAALHFAIDATELGVWDYNPITHKFTANERLKAWYGLQAEGEIDASVVIAIITKEDRQRVANAMQKALEWGGGDYDIEYTIVHPVTHHRKILRAKGKAIFNADNIANRFSGTTQDLTAQALASRQVKESEQRFRNLVENTLSPVCIFKGEDMVLVLGNQPLLDVWNVDAHAIGKPLSEILPEVKDSPIMGWLLDVYHSGVTLNLPEIPFAFLRKTGEKETLYFNFTYQPYREIDGAISGVMAQANDVTEQVLARKKVEESEKKFQAAIAAVEGIIWTNNAVGEMEGEQPGWTTLTGQSYEEYVGYGWVKAVHPDDAQPTVEAWNEAVKNKRTFVFEHRLETKENGWKLFSVKAAPAFDERGEIQQWVGVHTDITIQREVEAKIRESEERFRTLADESPMFVFIVDPDPQAPVSYWNKTWLDYTGQSAKEAAGRAWEGIIFEEDIPLVMECFTEAFTAQHPYFIPAVRTRRHDGEYRWHAYKGNPKYLANGEFNGYIGVGFDVHEQKLAEETLAYRTALLEAHNEASVDGVLLVDAKGKIISFNQRFIEVWNMPQQIVDLKDDEAALSFAMRQLVNPAQFIEKVRYLYENPKETSFDELKFKDGKIVERNGYPVIGEDGTYYAWSWTFRDVTAQKNYEKTIIESEERFRLLSNEMPQFVWTGDANGQLGYFNEAVYAYSGFSKEDMVKDGWIQIVHPDDREENIRLWQQSIATGKDFIFEHRFKRADGEYRWQLSRAVPQRDVHGAIQQWIGTSTDIQDRKDVEEQLENLVAQRTKELQRSNEDLQQFAHVASHDLKEPIRKIKTFTGRLEDHLDGTLDEAGRRYIERINVATNRMYNMIDGVLAFSTTNASMQMPQRVDLNELLDSIETDLEVALQRTAATLLYDELPTVEGSSVLLYQLFYNLINNSIKFAKATVPPQIFISSKTFINGDTSFARITLQDEGIGFEPEQAQRIFETFTRLNSKDQYEGTGLGLSLCKKIAERHGGSIVAIGTPGEGARFIITLPMKQKQTSI